MKLSTKILLTTVASVCGIILVCTHGFVTAQPRQYPFMALLYIQHESESWCGGTLIQGGRILTAAHCVQGASYINVTFGENILDYALGYHLNKPRIITHKDFDKATLNNDIALIFLDGQELMINVVSLSSEENALDEYEVLGWALDDGENVNDKLLTKKVAIADMKNCEAIPNATLNDDKICAVGISSVKPCTADSGGPLLAGNVQVGIVSGGPKDCTGLAVYTRLKNYLSWIEEHSRPNGGSKMKYHHFQSLVMVIIALHLYFIK